MLSQQILLRFLGLMFVVQQLGCVMATIFTSRTLGKMDFPLAQTMAWMFHGAQPDEIKQVLQLQLQLPVLVLG